MLIDICRECESINLKLIEDICLTLTDYQYNYDMLLSHCRDFSNFQIKDFDSVIELLKKLKYIVLENGMYKINKNYNKQSFANAILKEMEINNELQIFLNLNKIQFYKNEAFFSINEIKLEDSALRNLLFKLEVFKNVTENQNLVAIDSDYLKYFIKNVYLTQEKLNLILNKEKIQGDLAEEFVLNYEKNRLGGLKEPFLVSKDNVMLGYDILSYESINDELKRYIEVKSFCREKRFFITRNEIEKAKEFGENYYIYFIDIRKIREDTYVPEIIKNPFKCIINNENIRKEIELYSINLEED